jgi:protein-L-isoaspartate(D-aspartate) O-methyltransferase
VLKAMAAIPRETFIGEAYRRHAYADEAVPIDAGQTISQPWIVARMTELVAVGPGDRVLDVGTGSGYQAAILAALGAEVVSIELEEELAEQARHRLIGLGYDVKVVHGDGSRGVPEEAPFAAIVVAAAAPDVPAPLVEQLEPGGRLVLPIGSRLEQVITLIRRTADGYDRELIEPAVFVPLLGEHGFGSR